MQLYGNKIWNDVTDNRHKAYFVMQEDVFRAVSQKLDAEGLNYYAYEQNGTYKMAVNAHDLQYFHEVIGKRLTEQMDCVAASRSNTPQSLIGNTEYRQISDKRYLASDIDLILKIAERLQAQGIPFSGRVYDDHATITVSTQHESLLLELNRQILHDRQQHRHAVSQHLVVGNVSVHDIAQPSHFLSHMKPQEFMQVKPMLDDAGIPYSGIVKSNGTILTVDAKNQEHFAALLNFTQVKQRSIEELQEAGFSAHQIALLDDVLNVFSRESEWSSVRFFMDPRFSDEQLVHIAALASQYIVQPEFDRVFDRSGILLEMIQYRDAAKQQITFDDALRDTAYSSEQREALWALYVGGIRMETIVSFFDETYSVEEMERVGVCYHDADIDGLHQIQLRHEQTEPPVLVGYDPIPDDAAVTAHMQEAEAEMQRQSPAGTVQPVILDTPEQQPAVNGDTFQIYRLNDDANEQRVRFEGYDTLQQLGIDICTEHYSCIYTGEAVGQNATLDGIFFTFNAQRPDDFIGYSLSVGDIIVLNQNDTQTAYMVDSVGFRELPDFFKERQQQTDLFSLPYSDREKQIFGNVPFRYISGKTYHKTETETALQIAQALADNDIPFSGRIKGGTTTLTVPASDEERYQEIAVQFMPQAEPMEETEAPAAADPPAAGLPLELHLGDHIRFSDDPQNTWIVTAVSDFMLSLENADRTAMQTAQMITGWQKHLHSDNVTVLPEKGLPDPPKKKHSARKRQAEGQLALFEPASDETKNPDERRALLTAEILRGTGFENGKLRVSEFVAEHHPSATELAEFMKKEYGSGGHGGPDQPNVRYDSKELSIRTTEGAQYSYTWGEVARVTAELIAQEQYLTAQDIANSLRSARYHLENSPDERSAYYEGILAKYEHHPLLAQAKEAAVEMPEEPADNGRSKPVEIAASKDGLVRYVMIEQTDSEYPWNVQRWSRRSQDDDFLYTGIGKFMRTEQEARSFGAAEIDRYEDTRCQDAIRTAVKNHYQDNRFDTDLTLQELQQHFDLERIALLLAAAVQDAEWDGRYSGDVKDWSRKELLLHDADSVQRAKEILPLLHPGLLNMLAEAVMQRQAELTVGPQQEIVQEESVQQPETQPAKPRNTLEHRIFKKMQALYPEIMQDTPTAQRYAHYENPNPDSGYEPLSIERLTDVQDGKCLISMMHTYEQNGDLMRDPDIVLRVDFVQQTATACSYRQDGLGIFREYPDGSRGQRDTNRFMLTWLDNLRDQPRELTKAIAEFPHNGTVYDIELLYQNGKMSEINCEGNSAAVLAYAHAIGIAREDAMDRAIRLINTYCQCEFEQDANFSNPDHVDLAARQDTQSGLPIEVYADLESYRLIRMLGGTVVSEQQYDSLEDLCENALQYLDFDALVELDAAEREAAQQPVYADAERLTEEPAHTEPAQPVSADYALPDDFTVAVGKKAKFQANIAAIQTLQVIEKEQRMATASKQEALAGYVGWGGIPEAFDSDNEAWSQEYAQLRALLTDEEYAAARASTQNAHYTQPMLIAQMYQALAQFGFAGGRVLEPSMGIGNFFGMMPEEMRRSSELYGVELDSISGRIAQQLYPSADIAVTGFEHTQFHDGAFDVVIGNVPFGNYRVLDAAYDDQKFKIHDYFLAKSMDKLKAGGVMAVITSAGTMDKKDAAARQYLAERAELIGAIRLPNDAFKANAGTEVTADILFFRKREEPLEADAPYPEWTQTSETEDGLHINSYFAEHPEMVLGTLQKSTNPFSSGVECVPIADADLQVQLSDAVSRLSAEISQEKSSVSVRAEQYADQAPYKTFFLRDGALYFRDSMSRPAEISQYNEKPKQRERIIGMISIRDAARAVIEAQTENCTDQELQKLQAVLTQRYDTFYQKFGLIHSRANTAVFREDDGFALICSLERSFDLKKGTLNAKADIFTKRTIRISTAVDHAETAEDALIISMQQRGKIDFPYMEQLYGKSKAEMIADLEGKIYPVPDLLQPEHITYQPADEYLSGNIRVKLEEAKAAAALNPIFEKNIAALEAVMPEKLRAGDITVRLGATWIDPKYIRQFIYEVLETPSYLRVQETPARGFSRFRSGLRDGIDVQYSPQAGLWNITNAKRDTSIRATRDFGTKALTAYEILTDVLNLRSPKVYMTVEDPTSVRGVKRVLDGEATTLAQKKAAALQRAFSEWIFRDPDRAAELVETYNRLFNSVRPREYDGSHLIFPNMSADITLLPHQKNAVAHALYGGNTLFAHCVGAGKTYEMIATAMEGKRLGLHHKSLFVVPKHLTVQIGADFLQLYPSANILVATAKDFEAGNRRELMARIATGNYDAIIISHEQFKALPLSLERATKQMQAEVDALTESISQERQASGKGSFTVKALERAKHALEQNIARLVASAKKDEQNVTFEQLGIDHIFVDEAHEMKNLLCPTKLQNLSGVSNSASQKAMDLFLKCRYLDEVTGGRGVTLATATPISNSITEIHTMLRYLAHQMLEEQGLASFDAFISTFGAPKTDWELSSTGTTWRQKTRMAGFDNLPELMSMWQSVADVQTAESLNLPVPECELHIVEAEPTQLQQEMVQELSDRADAVQAGGVDSHEDNLLLITGDGRKVGLDPRLVDPELPDDPATKLNLCVENVFRIWNETAEQRSTQMIFCDLGVPHTQKKAKNEPADQDIDDAESTDDLFSLEEELPFCVYDDIKAKLVVRGVPAEEIAFIHDAKTEAQKSALFEKVRSGEVRVIIGSTRKMGTGTNVQDKLIALHDLDIPWRPADLEQRRGRMVRQGNESERVHLYRYVTKGTFDAVSYQTLEAKQRFISQIMTTKSAARSCEDIDQSALTYAQIKAACTGDSRFQEQMQLQADVQALRLQRSEHLNAQDEMREKVAKLPHQIFMAEGRLSLIQQDYRRVSALPRDDNGITFAIEIDGKEITDKTEAAKLVAAFFNEAKKNPGQDIMVGNFCGFPLTVNCQMNHIFASLHGAVTYTGELSMSNGYIVRGLQDIVNGIGRELQKQTRAISEMQVDLRQAEERANQPFPYEEELEEKSARLETLSDALRKEAMANTNGSQQGRQTFYFDKTRRTELRTVSAQAAQMPGKAEPQQNNDSPHVG